MHRMAKQIGLTLMLVLATTVVEANTKVTQQPFGTLPDGTPVTLYTLTDAPFEARIMTYGGVLVSFKAPDKFGKLADVLLGFDDAAGYYNNFNSPKNAFFDARIMTYGGVLVSFKAPDKF